MKPAQAFTLAVLSVALVACQSMRVIDRPLPSDLGRLTAGDRVGILLKDGTRFDLAVTEVTATHLNGKDGSRAFSVLIESIDEVRCQKSKADKSFGEMVQRALAVVAASLALASGDQDSVNAPPD